MEYDMTVAMIGGSFSVGDRLHYSTDTNRVVRRVIRVHGETSIRIAQMLRPSRGYARHVRGEKARRRRELR